MQHVFSADLLQTRTSNPGNLTWTTLWCLELEPRTFFSPQALLCAPPAPQGWVNCRANFVVWIHIYKPYTWTRHKRLQTRNPGYLNQNDFNHLHQNQASLRRLHLKISSLQRTLAQKPGFKVQLFILNHRDLSQTPWLWLWFKRIQIFGIEFCDSEFYNAELTLVTQTTAQP